MNKINMTTNKEIIGGIIAIAFAIALIGIASADEGYCFLYLSNGQSIPAPGIFSTGKHYTCNGVSCSIFGLSPGSIGVKFCTLNGEYASYIKCSGTCQNPDIEEPDLTLTANFPFADYGVFTKQTFNMNIQTNKIANIDLINHIAGAEINLCPNCAVYKKPARFPEGQNDITIRAVKGDEILTQRIRFFIDNKKPRIIRTTPLANKYSKGLFTVIYDEANIVSVDLYYGKKTSPVKQALSGCESGKNKQCSINADLTGLDGEVYYWFEIKDIANNVIASRPVKIYVDQITPVFNSVKHTINRRNAIFTLNVTEKNLDKIYYYDNDNPRKKVMCSILKNGICTARFSFTKGEHSLLIEAYDKAGNNAIATDNFTIL